MLLVAIPHICIELFVAERWLLLYVVILVSFFPGVVMYEIASVACDLLMALNNVNIANFVTCLVSHC